MNKNIRMLPLLISCSLLLSTTIVFCAAPSTSGLKPYQPAMISSMLKTAHSMSSKGEQEILANILLQIRKHNPELADDKSLLAYIKKLELEPAVILLIELHPQQQLFKKFLEQTHPASSAFFSSSDQLTQKLLFLVGQERSSLKIAIYHIQTPAFIDALARAKINKPQLTIEIIIDKYCHEESQEKESLEALKKAGIVIYPLGARKWTMHEKFIVFGKNALTEHPLLWQGSYNLTETQTRDNVTLFHNPSLIEVFNKRFEHLKNAYTQGLPVNPMAVDQGIPTALFSPRGNIRQKLLDFIHQETRTIFMAMHTFYPHLLGEPLKRASEHNVQVTLLLSSHLFNDGSAKSRAPITKEVIADFQHAGIRLYKYMGPGLMHHKFFIFEHNSLQGKRLLWSGTYNATEPAEDKNCEDVIISDEQPLIDAFYKEFEDMKSHSLLLSGVQLKRSSPDILAPTSEEPSPKKKV
jgi:hypothetical protein